MGERSLRLPRGRATVRLASPTIEHASHVRVSEIANCDVILVDADDRLSEATDELADHGRSFAVAVDGEGRPIGVLTLVDAARALGDAEEALGRPQPVLAAPRRRGLSEPLGRGFHLEPTEGPRVRDVVRAALAIPMETSVARAAAALAYEGINQAVITDLGVVHGVVSWEDLLRWFAQQADYVVPDRTGRRGSQDTRARAVERRGMVVVIEDDADVATTMAEVLHDEGYGVITTPNGREALDVLRALPAPPGLILLDLMMPEMNGWEFREAQIRDESLATIPVVIMTAHADRFDRDELHRPSALLRKPLSTDVLIDTVGRHYHVVN